MNLAPCVSFYAPIGIFSVTTSVIDIKEWLICAFLFVILWLPDLRSFEFVSKLVRLEDFCLALGLMKCDKSEFIFSYVVRINAY